jgi:signal transduction histidine kinase/CheY-like chemotaxis protein
MTPTLAQPDSAAPQAPVADASRFALDFVHDLLLKQVSDPPPLEQILGELARAFGATAAGLAGIRQEIAVVKLRIDTAGDVLRAPSRPWEEQPLLLSQVRKLPTAVPARLSGGRSCLLAAYCPHDAAGWLLWLEDPEPRSWTPGEQGALTLAAALLARLPEVEVGTGRGTRWLDQARLQQRMEDSAFVAGRLAHDFGNVFTGVLGFAELSLGQLLHGSAVHQYVTEIFHGAQQGAKLIQQLNLFSKRGGARACATSLAGAITDEQARLRPGWGAAVALKTMVPSDLPPVAIEPEPLKHLLAQLLDNAREAIATTGTVTVAARQIDLLEADCLELLGNPPPGPCVELTIADTGCGFTPEARHRLFVEPFFSTKPRHRGLGLASVYGIVHNNRGGLRLDLGRERGAVVQVFLPLVASKTAAPRPGLPTTSVTAKGPKVLVVDDDPPTLQLICSTLERAGYRVQAAVDGLQALDAFATADEPFQLVLSDVVMPRMSGFDLVRQLLHQNPNVSVLFTSGHVPTGFAGESWTGGNFDLLPKPFRPEGLLRAVQVALDRPAAGNGASGEAFPGDKSL